MEIGNLLHCLYFVMLIIGLIDAVHMDMGKFNYSNNSIEYTLTNPDSCTEHFYIFRCKVNNQFSRVL
jgi:hypothetical protein